MQLGVYIGLIAPRLKVFFARIKPNAVVTHGEMHPDVPIHLLTNFFLSGVLNPELSGFDHVLHVNSE